MFGFSWLYQKLIKPALKNFKGEPKPKNEPAPTPPAPTNQNQPPIIVIPPQQPAPPTNYYQPYLSSNQPITELTSENMRELSDEIPENEPKQEAEKNEQPCEESPAPTATITQQRSPATKRKRNKNNRDYEK